MTHLRLDEAAAVLVTSKTGSRDGAVALLTPREFIDRYLLDDERRDLSVTLLDGAALALLTARGVGILNARGEP